MDLRDLIPFLKPGKKSTPAFDEAAGTEGALNRLDEQRAGTQEQINTLAARRTGMLLDSKVDSLAIVAIDAELATLRVDLERADELETALLERLHALQRQVRADDEAEFAQRYEPAIAEFVSAFRGMLIAREALADLRSEAATRGWERSLNVLPMPIVGLGLTREAIAAFEAGARAQIASFAPPEPPAQLHVIEFILTTSDSRGNHAGYRVGDKAGFSAAEAHHFVSAGFAKFVDTRAAQHATRNLA